MRMPITQAMASRHHSVLRSNSKTPQDRKDSRKQSKTASRSWDSQRKQSKTASRSGSKCGGGRRRESVVELLQEHHRETPDDETTSQKCDNVLLIEALEIIVTVGARLLTRYRQVDDMSCGSVIQAALGRQVTKQGS